MLPVFYSPAQLEHQPTKELSDGQLVDAFETPARVQSILEALQKSQFVRFDDVAQFGLKDYARVHADAYLHFLEQFWTNWTAAGRASEAFPFVWPVRDFRADKVPTHIDGQLGRFSFDAGTPLTKGTWSAAKASANAALSGAMALNQGAALAFSLCRPPGHHAGRDYFGGYCFLNNAAIAAQSLIDQGAKRVSILDVDYHHGNGTQAIFYDRADVQFISIHADPMVEYPYFLGHADEKGEGKGEGYNVNYPLSHGTQFAAWMVALENAIAKIDAYAPDAVLISLGADIYEGDPISQFKIREDEFIKIGARLAELKGPKLVIMEGGYAVGALGDNVTSFLRGIAGA
jgi:acetoin utilization deacetylase AcuC-like enzyme